MSKKYKVTGCAKFFFVVLLLAPLAFIGASYYNGQDPFEKISGLFSDGDRVEQVQNDTEDLEARIRDLEKALADCQEATGN